MAAFGRKRPSPGDSRHQRRGQMVRSVRRHSRRPSPEISATLSRRSRTSPGAPARALGHELDPFRVPTPTVPPASRRCASPVAHRSLRRRASLRRRKRRKDSPPERHPERGLPAVHAGQLRAQPSGRSTAVAFARDPEGRAELASAQRLRPGPRRQTRAAPPLPHQPVPVRRRSLDELGPQPLQLASVAAPVEMGIEEVDPPCPDVRPPASDPGAEARTVVQARLRPRIWRQRRDRELVAHLPHATELSPPRPRARPHPRLERDDAVPEEV